MLYRQAARRPEPATGLDTWVQSDHQSNLGVEPGRKVEPDRGRRTTRPDPEWAAEFVNKLVARHLERRAKLSQQSEARRFFEVAA